MHIEILAVDVDVMLFDNPEDRLLHVVERFGIPVPAHAVLLIERRLFGEFRFRMNAFGLKPEQEPLVGRVNRVRDREQVARRVRRRIDNPVSDVAVPVRPAVRIMLVLVRRTVPARVDPEDVERKVVLEPVVENVEHHLRRLIPAPRGQRDNRFPERAVGVARRILLDHIAVNERLEFRARHIGALEEENGRLKERFARPKLESGSQHAELHAERIPVIDEPRAPAAGPADTE